jgi:hypothetical protein
MKSRSILMKQCGWVSLWAMGLLTGLTQVGGMAPVSEALSAPASPTGSGSPWVQIQEWVLASSTNLFGTCLRAEQCPLESGRGEVLRVVGYEAARVDPVRAVTLATGMEPGSDRDRLLVHALREWAMRDRDAALDWVRRGADDLLRCRLLGAVAVAMAEEDAVGAAEVVAGEMGEGPEQARAAVGVLQRWAGRDPQSALAWLAQFSDADLRRAAVRAMVSLWSDRTPQEVEGWLAALADPVLRDEIAMAYRRLGTRSTVVVAVEE